MTSTILRLFVYGTLKRGYWNHQRFCAQARSIEPAVVWGRLYHLHAGLCPALQWHPLGTSHSARAPFTSQAVVPALEVPESSILATGTADPLADTRTQNAIQLPENAMTQPEGDWDLVHGELMTFANPGFDLPPIDRLEGFRPGGHSMYQRVMVAVLCGRTPIPAWTYWMPRIDTGNRLGTGVWHRPC